MQNQELIREEIETITRNLKLQGSTANKYSSASHREQKNKKITGQIKFSAVTIKQ